MKRALLLASLFASISVEAQQLFPTISKDTSAQYHVQLNEAVIVDTRIFLNDTLRYNYNQMKYYVTTIMPYVNAASKMFNEIDQNTDGMSRRARKQYIKSREEEIKLNFEDKLKQLNITQGRYLVKLINRQCKSNCYDIVRELKNPITAAYYQSWAKLNGINLNRDYLPEDEPDLERIMKSLGY